jgi:hypothetical protein
MAQVVAKTGIKKEKGWLYFVDKKGDISKATMSRGKKRTKGKKLVLKVGIKKEKGWLYFIDKKGNISKAKMLRGR